MLRRFQAFLYSRRNIVGSLLALGGLALYFTGIVGGLLWLPIVAALYLIGVLLVPPEQGLALRLDAAQDASDVRSGLDRLLASIRGQVAGDLYATVVSIRASILATLATDGTTADATDPNVYLIRQTALSYLPEAFATYLRIPRDFAESRPVADGRTPHDALLGQLDLMDRRLQDVADNIAQHDSDKLLANGRFLAEKFAVSSLNLGAGTDQPDAAAVTASVAQTGSAVTAAQPAAVPEFVPEQVSEPVPESQRTSEPAEQAAARERAG